VYDCVLVGILHRVELWSLVPLIDEYPAILSMQLFGSSDIGITSSVKASVSVVY